MNNEDKYLISIVVPCYNCESTFDRMIESLLDQKLDKYGKSCNYQIVLVDDGSIDDTSSKCDYYSHMNENVKVIHKPNGGLVSAWKTGVNNSEGEYIAFCDSDDYIDLDFISRVSLVIDEYCPDIIVFGMTKEYYNGDKTNNDVLLEAGHYNRRELEEQLFPRLLYNGDMQSELVGSSRCNKVFSNKLVCKIQNDVPDDISFGEDDVTCFAAELNANSLFVVRDFYPYHYVRNNESMIGVYDHSVFEKIDYLYERLIAISKEYEYQWPEQIRNDILSILFLYIKKEICRNPGSFDDIKKKLISVIESSTYRECFDEGIIKNYKISKRVFASLVNKRYLMAVYVLTKLSERIRGRNV